jgi:hypothetical protein
MTLHRSIEWLGRLQDTVPQFLRPLEFRPVQTTEELLAATHLVYKEYLKRHYVRPNASGLKLSVFHSLPTTSTFIALHGRRLIATITAIEDSPLGLPMDEAYKLEVDRLRRSHHRLVEATMLALNTDLFGRGVFTMFHAKKLLLTLGLFRAMFEYMRSCTDCDELVACFNPKHQVLYDFLQLRPLGPLKSYTSANGNPAIARHLNIAETQRQARTHVAYRFFYGSTLPAKAFAKRLVLTPQDLRKLFVIRTSLFASLSPTELAYIKQCYPQYDFQTILAPGLSLYR